MVWGGILLYIKEGLTSSGKNKINDCSYNDVLFCEVGDPGKNSMLIGVVYRSPNSTEENNKNL